MWDGRPPGAAINRAANRELWNDRATEDLHLAAARVTCPVTMLFGADDPCPWAASDSLLAALPDASRTVLDHAGHAPWAERPADTRRVLIDALRSPASPSREQRSPPVRTAGIPVRTAAPGPAADPERRPGGS